MLTILMPLRDFRGPFLRQAVESVLEQDSPDWRVLLIDQKGTESRPSWLTDSRVDSMRNPGNSVCSALNAGMRRAATSFVCSLHDDDRLAPHAVSQVLRAIANHPEADYFHSSNRWIDEHDRFLSQPRPPVTQVLAENFVQAGQVKHLHTWRVDAALAMGGCDETLGPHGADDYDFPWCMAEAGYRFQAIEECLYYYRDHRSAPRLTTHVTLSRQLAEIRKILRKHGVAEDEIQRQLEIRSAGYLRQALYLDERDREQKLSQGFTPDQGWRELGPPNPPSTLPEGPL